MNMSSVTVALAMFGIIPAALFLVGWLRPLRGVTAIFVLGWLLLPNAMYKVSMLPPYTKSAAVSMAAMIAMIVYDSGRLAAFRPRWVDIPILIWCLSPSASSLANGLGPQDAIAVLLDQLLTWGVPYLFGRLYFGDVDSIGVLARGVMLGGILYIPLCVYEMRMAPVLHTNIYGFHQHQFLQSIREGGYRPTVFLQHGLAVGFFMSTAAMLCTWLWRRRAASAVGGIPVAWVALALALVALFCKSAGATTLFVMGWCALWTARAFNSKIPLCVLLVVAPLYMCVRATGIWSGQELLDVVRPISADRADSLQCRLTSEDFLAAHALKQPVLGWGGWGRNLVGDEAANANVITDGFWVIVLGKYGLAGLTAVTSLLLLPVLVFVLRTPRLLLFSARGAPAMALGVLVVLFVIDSLFNAMLNPMYVLAVGGLAGIGTLALQPAQQLVPRPSGPARREAVRPARGPRSVIEIPPPAAHVVRGDPHAGGDADGPDTR